MADVDDTDEEAWCNKQRAIVIDYLAREKLTHGEIGDRPAWHVYPYVAVWAIESVRNPGSVGWWAISGDLPTDYITCGLQRHPREGMRDIALRWQKGASRMEQGKAPEDWNVGVSSNRAELAPLLASRAEVLLSFVADDGLWEG
jgi:hypothetical protein